ncbi:hypothetical protein [Paenibacillus sp. 481]|uniref:hypothetical protein n=1 Tax=Paenibacillus sp. 481 TaxID=2835869 RepID=UPI001E512BE6|nr:hypothetical protein [Paenibacillus sp. 481]UHA73710.1 hypothetical protein KIK04_00590 [Paenibacillus sp. 481]
MWATNAPWVWVLFYAILGANVIGSVVGLFKKNMRLLSSLHLAVIVSGFVVGFMNAIGRTEGQTELQFFMNQLMQGSLWAIYVLFCILFSIIWWIQFVKK